MSQGALVIPVAKGSDHVTIYADELLSCGDGGASAPIDSEDVLNLLIAEQVPINVWRDCAVEFHRAGRDDVCEEILNTLIDSLTTQPEVREIYVKMHSKISSSNFYEKLNEIYNILASKSFGDYCRKRGVSGRDQQSNPMRVDAEAAMKQFFKYIKLADDTALKVVGGGVGGDTGGGGFKRVEYTLLLKSFYELASGNVKKAETDIKLVHDRVVRLANNNKSPKQPMSVESARRFLFVSLVGLGICNYVPPKSNYSQAAENFSKAIQQSPSCDVSVRVALASCCFYQEQYDKCQFALDRVLSIQPSNSRALLMMAFIEQVCAKKDKAGKAQHHRNSYHYSTIAATIDPNFANAINSRANFVFHSWSSIVNAAAQTALFGSSAKITAANAISIVVDPTFNSSNSIDLAPGDLVRINKLDVMFSVTGVQFVTEGESRVLVVTVDQTFAEEALDGQLAQVEIKQLTYVLRLAKEALSKEAGLLDRADSLFMIGRVHYSLGEISRAFQYFRESIEANPSMVLAWVCMAQIYLSQGDLSSSLESFEKIQTLVRDDKDVNAYLMLLRGLLRKEQCPFEQIREVASGFQYEAELWLSQGQLHQRGPSLFPAALRCYLNALDCIENSRGKKESGLSLGGVPAAANLCLVLSNVAVLYQAQGSLPLALEYMRRAVASIPVDDSDDDSVADPAVRSKFTTVELEDVFYHWSSEFATATFSDGSFIYTDVTDTRTRGALRAGDELLVDDIIHTVIESHPRGVRTACALLHLYPQRGDSQQHLLRRKVVKPARFVQENLTLIFNYARILESCGKTTAALELYIDLMKRHPSFIECYLRVAKINLDMALCGESAVWLSRALNVKSDESDANICLGDLYALTLNWEDAKRCYEKVLVTSSGGKGKRDNRSMLSLGNMYFMNLHNILPEKYEAHVKDSYKFFHHVLSDDNKNVYAAVGLGMVCAEKRELDVAREIFTRAREVSGSGGGSDDVQVNLAHIHLLQGRFTDAEHLYHATIRSLSKHTTGGEKITSLYETMALAQMKNKKFEESLSSLCRAVHLDPTLMRSWYNNSIVRGNLAIGSMARSHKTSTSIEESRAQLVTAHRLFKHFAGMEVSGKGLQSDSAVSQERANVCEKNMKVFEEHLGIAVREEARRSGERQRNESEHQQRIDMKRQEELLRQQEEQRKRLELQNRAVERTRKLSQLTEKWVATAEAVNQAKSNRGSKGKGAKGSGGDLDHLFADDDDDDDVVAPAVSVVPDVDLFGDDDEEATATTAESAAATLGGINKRPRSALEDEDEELFGIADAADNAAAAAEVDLFGDDDEADVTAVKRARNIIVGDDE